MTITDFFETRTNYCPIVVETMDSELFCKDIYSEMRSTDSHTPTKEKEFLTRWGSRTISNWCIITDESGAAYMLLRIEIP